MALILLLCEVQVERHHDKIMIGVKTPFYQDFIYLGVWDLLVLSRFQYMGAL